MVRARASLFCLLLLNAACSQRVHNLHNCALHAANEINGTALLVTGVESEGRLKLSIFRDKCSERLAKVYFTPDAVSDITAHLESMPGREFDDVKVAILDAEIVDAKERGFDRSGQPILINYVYSIKSLGQQSGAQKSEVR